MVFLFLYNKSQALDLPAMLNTGGHNIDSCGVNAAMTQYIGKLCDVFFNAVKSACKQLSEIVGKHLARFDTGSFTQLFHRRPDVTAIQIFARSCDKDCARNDPLPLCVIYQYIFQLARNDDRPGFIFAVHGDLAMPNRLHSKITQL